MADIAILAISAKNEKGWREAIGADGATYSIGPDKFTDAEIEAAIRKKVITGETSEKDGKKYIWPLKPGGAGGWKPRPQTPEWQKFPAFATSYSAEYVIKPLLETHVPQEEAKANDAKLTDLISLVHKSVSRKMCDTMIELHKQCQDDLGG
ncbi:MAG: hypothetical protein OET79_07575 [Nitrospirota bacterium]|nr:hypothetical protein [Nitrospirota bacterium]